jgi:low affinity Fe/Cu permease
VHGSTIVPITMARILAGKGSTFDRFSNRAARIAGHPTAFAAAIGLIGIWLIGGPVFGFSDTWQLVINTATTIVTFLMVFLIQNTQNRDGAAVQIKLDELIRSANGAHNELLDLEDLGEGEIEVFRKEYEQLAADARKESRRAQPDTGTPEVELPSWSSPALQGLSAERLVPHWVRRAARRRAGRRPRA